MSDLKTGSMTLHCGGRRVTRNALDYMTPAQEETRTHKPIAHGRFIEYFEDAFERNGIKVQNGIFAVDGKEDDRVMALWDVHAGDGYTFCIGARHANDKTFAASMLAGDRVWICDNLSVSAEVEVVRKHTTRIHEDLPGLIDRGLIKVPRFIENRARSFERMREMGLTDTGMHDLAVRAVDAGALTKAQAWRAIEYWRKPEHADFEERNVWSAYNACTDKAVVGDGWSTSATRTADRSMRLNRLMVATFPSLREIAESN